VSIPMMDVNLMDCDDVEKDATAVPQKTTKQGRFLTVMLPLLGITVVALVLTLRSCPLQ
jgi:hypothetical protein